jgi:acyl-CoA synthetase (AMP-forming)/AMP-acid ligase II
VPAPPAADGVPPALAAAEAELLAPGGLFETEVVEVAGRPMAVFRNRMRSLREALAASAGHGDAPYVTFTDGERRRTLTFAEHHRAVAAVAAALAERHGVGPGDRVAILAANCPEWIVTFWAATSLGAIAVGCNGWWVGPEIRHALADCDPALLVADRARLARLDGDAGVPTVVVEDDFAALVSHAPGAALPDTPIGEDDPALILYTSGTTGRPKGAVNTHRNVIAAVGLSFFHGLRMMMSGLTPPSPDPPVQLVTSPLFHVSGLHMAAVAFLVGGVRSVWTTGRFDPVTVMRVIEAERVTHWSFTPTMLHRVVTHPDVGRYDLSSLRSGGGGGAAFSPTLQRRAKEVLPALRTTMGVGYGQTECAALATLNAGEELNRYPTSVGRPLPTVELAIRDPQGRPVPDGVDGEICVRGPMVMPGYWRRPEETAAVLDADGWLRTGDLGHLAGGRLYLAARRFDLILRGGENVYPAEVEQCLEEHPDVAEVAVLGVAHEEWGQEVAAIVVPAAGRRPEAAALEAFCRERLAAFKVPTRWEVRDEPLPRNAAGKVMRHVLAGAELTQREA